IPGVAQPPVYTFIGLLIVFVILVGPIAYRWTSKTKRLHLMFAIAPLLAMLTTMSLFAYGIVADGFSTIARVRQITFVDGTSKDAVVRARSTYFTGLQAKQGLRFSDNTEVIPYMNSLGRTFQSRVKDSVTSGRRIVVTGDDQAFDASFLPSRDQKQFVTHCFQRNLGNLTFGNNREGQEPLPNVRFVTSTISYPLRKLIVRDLTGQYWYAGQVPVSRGATELFAMNNLEVSKTLGEIFQSQPLVSTFRRKSNWGLGGRRELAVTDLIDALLRSRVYGQADATRVQDGAFEGIVQQHLLFEGDIPPGTFVATADVPADSLALPDVELVDSIHIVMGTMP
ncbi:MAG: hypothetical protein AAF989_17690, partial [Planctomycetota bacterium]